MKQVILKRRSIRSFKKKELTLEDQASIKKILKQFEQVKGPFGNTIRLYLLNLNEEKGPESKIVGLYGYIKNAPAFIAGSTKNTFEGLVDYGYVFQAVLLELTKRGFGTVWLGGDFERKDMKSFARKGDVVPSVSPVGYPAKLSWREKFLRSRQEAHTREPFSSKFFNGNFETPIRDDQAQKTPYYDYLELIRLAPSALNKQPWRVIVDGQKLHLYLRRTPDFKHKDIDVEMLNMGVAMQHLEVGLNEDKRRFNVARLDDAPKNKAFDYIATYELDA